MLFFLSWTGTPRWTPRGVQPFARHLGQQWNSHWLEYDQAWPLNQGYRLLSKLKVIKYSSKYQSKGDLHETQLVQIEWNWNPPVTNGLNQIKPVKTSSNWSKWDKSGRNQFKQVQTKSNLSKWVQTGSNRSEPVQMGQNLVKLVKPDQAQAEKLERGFELSSSAHSQLSINYCHINHINFHTPEYQMHPAWDAALLCPLVPVVVLKVAMWPPAGPSTAPRAPQF